jgi:hypothetical protein
VRHVDAGKFGVRVGMSLTFSLRGAEPVFRRSVPLEAFVGLHYHKNANAPFISEAFLVKSSSESVR